MNILPLIPVGLFIGAVILLLDISFNGIPNPWSRWHIIYTKRRYFVVRRSIIGLHYYLSEYNSWTRENYQIASFSGYYEAEERLKKIILEDEERRKIREEGKRVVTGPVEVEKSRRNRRVYDSQRNLIGFYDINGRYYDFTSPNDEP